MFRPTAAVPSVTDITADMLKKMDIRGLILDVDNTLARHNDPVPAQGAAEWIRKMKAAGIKLVIVSNNHAPRVAPFADMLGIPFTAEGAKPLPRGFTNAMKILRLPRKHICAVGDQIFTDILGANIFGIRSIFVTPIEPETSIFFRIKRTAEKPFLPKTGGRQDID